VSFLPRPGTTQVSRSALRRNAARTKRGARRFIQQDQVYISYHDFSASQINVAASNVTSVNQKRGLFTKQDFVYDETRDCYRCPAGEALTYRYESFELGRQIRYYTTRKCADCPIKHRCTTNQRGRRISRWVDEKLLDDMARRVRARPEIIRRRQQLSEPPFGTIKRAMGHSYFLMRGLNKVGAEMSLTVLSYNLKRAINLIGVKKLIAAVT